MNRFSIGVLAAMATLAFGCSGTDSSGLLLGDSAPPTEDSGTNPTEDAAAQQDATATEDATTGEDAHVQDATVVDTGPDVPVGPADSKIQCGPSITCSAQKEICCWHQSSTIKPYECVTNVNDCAGTYDAPMTCSTQDNCASQGNPNYLCCATSNNWGWGTCSNYTIASSVTCKAACDWSDYEVGCSVQKQNCTDSFQTCVTSKCTFPGATMCY